uniref:Uncharacterized protein n=1 Tax=Candidatus Nitrotoga fabula TaxID=2182327 RepID=A0A2X0R5J8_9PROT|nr:protein of unknown function [Candidatus Nitrotoga fabula]
MVYHRFAPAVDRAVMLDNNRLCCQNWQKRALRPGYLSGPWPAEAVWLYVEFGIHKVKEIR